MPWGKTAEARLVTDGDSFSIRWGKGKEKNPLYFLEICQLLGAHD